MISKRKKKIKLIHQENMDLLEKWTEGKSVLISIEVLSELQNELIHTLNTNKRDSRVKDTLAEAIICLDQIIKVFDLKIDEIEEISKIYIEKQLEKVNYEEQRRNN